jgi:ABC-type sugar transport system substrate-binding protein
MSSFRIAAVVIIAFAGVAGSLGYVSLVSAPALMPIRILFVGNTQDPDCDAMLRGVFAAAGEFQAELEVCDLANRQAPTDWSADRLAAHYDGIVLASQSAGAIECSSDSGASLRIVSIGACSEGLAPHVYVELNAYQLAQAIAKLLRECMPVGGRVGVLVSSLQSEEQADRVVALRKVMEQSAHASSRRYELVECPVDAPAVAYIARSLDGAGNVECVVDLTGEPAVELIEAVQSASAQSMPRLVTTDQSESALAAVEAGKIYAIVGHDYRGYGYHAAARLASLCRTNEFGLPVAGHGRLSVQPICVRRHDAHEHRRLTRTSELAPAA